MADKDKQKKNPWRDAPGIGPPKPTRYLKEDFGPEWGRETIFTPQGLKARVKRMLYGDSPMKSLEMAQRDITERRSTDIPKNKSEKDQSKPMGDTTPGQVETPSGTTDTEPQRAYKSGRSNTAPSASAVLPSTIRMALSHRALNATAISGRG